MSPFCHSLTQTRRRPTREVMVGTVGVGGDNPIRIQSMTTSDTKDVAATVEEAVALAEAGCEIVRVTAPNVTAARCLQEIRKELDQRKIDVPLVADIHFLPAAAMEAVEHVEKVRINPGNYADRKKFAVREYTDSQYEEELQRLYEAFSPLVKRCKELGRSMRIGTNHGSLSDRIMNRYGDTPLGMVESAIEFLRIADSHGYRDIILSMKASNPKVMIQAYRLLAARLDEENMPCPLHLGVTEAGDGEDGRVKSAIGIGSLLADGLGDTIRVSLTEDSVYEIPVARDLAEKFAAQTRPETDQPAAPRELVTLAASFAESPFSFTRRSVAGPALGGTLPIAHDQPPRVFARIPRHLWTAPDFASLFHRTALSLRDNPIEGIVFEIESTADKDEAITAATGLFGLSAAVFDYTNSGNEQLDTLTFPKTKLTWIVARRFASADGDRLAEFLVTSERGGFVPAVDLSPADLPALKPHLMAAPGPLIYCLSQPAADAHSIGTARALAGFLRENRIDAPIWIRNTGATAFRPKPGFLSCLLEASILTGSLLCDGIGDIVSIESEDDFVRATKLAYNVLQGSGARISKTEFVACPSCGRTLFDLQSTTRRIREKTGHLKGLKIAIMGCIVNGPGEMADADFGYVGGGPGRVNLYVGKECVEFNVPAAEADQRLIDLIKRHGKWTEPEETIAAPLSTQR